MAVTTTNTSVTYTGTGSVGPFSFNFSASTAAAVKVIQGGTVLAPTAYSIVPINNNYDNGGLVTLFLPCPAGQSLVLQRITPLTQTTIFYDNLPLPMHAFENALDKQTEIVQELAAEISGISAGVVAVGLNGIVVTGNGTAASPLVISYNGGASPLTITSFTGGNIYEVGQSITFVAFNITYTGAPTSGNITNTDAINSPYALSTPFTNANITGPFHHTTAASVTFTLTLSDGIASPTMTNTISWKERIFGGVAPTGATSTVTSSGTQAVLSTGTIGTAQLGPETVGQTFGPYSPSGQCIYLLLTGGAHSFIDAGTGFPFAFNAPIAVSFTNQYGVSEAMYLYQSTNPLTGTFTPKVAS